MIPKHVWEPEMEKHGPKEKKRVLNITNKIQLKILYIKQKSYYFYIFKNNLSALPVEWGVWPPNQGDTRRASGDAPTSIGDGEGRWCLPFEGSLSRRGVSSHSHLPLSQSDLPVCSIKC